MLKAPAPHRTRGLSLVESLMALAVTAILVGTTAPGFKGAIERRHLEGSAAQLETDLHLARGAAVTANRSLRIGFEHDASGSCYVVHSGAADDCRCSGSETPVCRGDAVAVRSVRFPAAGPVQLQTNVRSMLLDADKGTVSPAGTLRLQGRDGGRLHLVVNIMGRVRQCTPTPPLAGYRAC